MPSLTIQLLKHLPDVLLMLGRCLTKDQYIIHIDQDAVVQQLTQQQVHRPLEVRWSILDTKWHNYEFKCAIPTCKRSLIPIALSYRNLVVAVPEVKFAKNLCSTQPSQHFVNPWERPTISHCICVQGPVVNAHTQPTTTLLLRKENWSAIR